MAQPNSNSNPHSSRQIITQGYLVKQGSLLNKSFKKKYFVLYQGRILICYDDNKRNKQNGEIDLSQVSSISYRDTKDNAKYKYVFDVVTPSKSWTLVCFMQTIHKIK